MAEERQITVVTNEPAPVPPEAPETPAAPVAETPTAPATEAEPPSDEAPDEGAETTPPPASDRASETDETPKWAQRRFDRFSRRIHDQERIIDELRAQNATLTQIVGSQRQTASAPSEGTETPAKPKMDDFETQAAYLEALADWTSERKAEEKVTAALKKRDEDDRQKQEAQAEQTRQQGWNRKLVQAQTKYQDYLEVVSNAPQIQVTPELYGLLQESEYGGDLNYYLFKYPAEAERLLPLSGTALYREIGKLEAKFEHEAEQANASTQSAAKEPQRPPRTAAPAERPQPPTPVTTGGGNATVPLEKLSYQDYKRARLAGRQA